MIWETLAVGRKGLEGCSLRLRLYQRGFRKKVPATPCHLPNSLLGSPVLTVTLVTGQHTGSSQLELRVLRIFLDSTYRCPLPGVLTPGESGALVFLLLQSD